MKIFIRVQLTLLGLVVIYAIALLCGVTVPLANREAFAGIWAVILLLIDVDKLKEAISKADDASVNPPPDNLKNDPAGQ
jgi:hypothetical protein